MHVKDGGLNKWGELEWIIWTSLEFKSQGVGWIWTASQGLGIHMKYIMLYPTNPLSESKNFPIKYLVNPSMIYAFSCISFEFWGLHHHIKVTLPKAIHSHYKFDFILQKLLHKKDERKVTRWLVHMVPHSNSVNF